MRIVALDIDEAVVNRMAEAVRHIEKGADVALSRAMAKTLNSLRAEVKRAARKTYTAKPAKRFSSLSVHKGKGRGRLEVTGERGLSLYHFLPSPKSPGGKKPRRGVTTKILKGGRRSPRQHDGRSKPFIMRKRQGGYGVFTRALGAGKHDWHDIEMEWGPSPIQALGRPDVTRALQEATRENFLKYFQHEVDVLAAGIVTVSGRR